MMITVPEFKFQSLSEYNAIVNRMAEAMKNGRLVFFIGAGISRIQGYPNWDEYIDRLIKYWESHINDDPAIQKSRVYVNALDQILNSNIDKKRKVDLVHQMIKQAFGQEMFEERQLDFEKYYFETLPPITEYNPVLTKLASLDASYITTNYDNQIEKHLDTMKTVSATVTDIADFDDRTDQVSLNTVIHLHGMPNGKPAHFISSSSSYKEHYYSDFQPISKIRNWIADKKLLLVFLGSSMEEDEILSLLSGINGNHIAFLASNHGENETGDCIRKITEDYHFDQNHTQVFWYGDGYKMLPKFVSQLVKDVRNVAYSEINDDDWYQFRDKSTPDETIVNILNKTESGLLEHYFYDLNSKTIARRVPQILSSNIFEAGSKNIPPSIWRVLDTNHQYLTSNIIDSIINYVRGGNWAYQVEAAVLFIRKLKLSDEQTLNLEKSLGSKTDLDYLSFYDWPNVMGWFLVKEIEKRHYLGDYYESETPRNYNLVPQAQEELINILNSNDFKFITWESAEDVINYDGFVRLYHAILENRFQIDNEKWESKIDKKLLCHPIFIKILMKVNEKKKLPENLVSKIISHVDFSDKNLGYLFNLFFDENYAEIHQLHGNIEKVQYEDGLTFGAEAKEVQQTSFVTEKDLVSDDVTLINKLTTYKNSRDQIRSGDYFYEQSITGTINFFKKILTNPETTVANKIIKLFTDNIPQLYNDYKDFYCWYLLEKNKEVTSDDAMVRYIINMYSDNKISNFNYYDTQMIEYLLNSDFFVDEINTAFWQIDTSNFDLPYLNQNEGKKFTYENFINSNLGKYLNLFKLVVEKVSGSKDIAKQKIDEIEDDNIRHFMMGRHYEMYKDNIPKTIYDLKGISSAYRLGSNSTVIFKDVTLVALAEGYKDSLIDNNVAIISLYQINPSEENTIAWDKVNFHSIFMYIFYTDYDFPYQREWLLEILSRKFNKYVGMIFRMFRKNSDSSKLKLGKLLSDPEEILKLSNDSINLMLITSKIDEIEGDLRPLFHRILTAMISSSRVEINIISMKTIDMVLGLADKEDRKQMFKGLKKSMSPGDLNRLKTKYSTI